MTENKAIQIIKREEQWESNASISNAFNTAIKALEENQQYHAIGTVDECQSAVDKQAAKKPRLIGNAMICPSCPKVYSNDRVTYCLNCGQKIDWG